MAEIRKHDPAQGNPIVEALRHAMGDPIRPVTPGVPQAARPKSASAPTTTSWVSLTLTPPVNSTEEVDPAES